VLVAPSLHARKPATNIRKCEFTRLDRSSQIGLEFILVRSDLDIFASQEGFYEPVPLRTDDARSKAFQIFDLGGGGAGGVHSYRTRHFSSHRNPSDVKAHQPPGVLTSV
jgi:hypothetical protein